MEQLVEGMYVFHKELRFEIDDPSYTESIDVTYEIRPAVDI